jgi:hypothetical protein
MVWPKSWHSPSDGKTTNREKLSSTRESLRDKIMLLLRSLLAAVHPNAADDRRQCPDHAGVGWEHDTPDIALRILNLFHKNFEFWLRAIPT